MDLYLDVFNHEVSNKKRSLVNEPVNRDLKGKNKFANNSEYVSDAIYRRILNRITNFKWSFVPHSIDEVDEGGNKFIRFIGLLVVPGFGVHTGIGTSPLKKKDNSNALAAAKTYAFKNACKEMGLAPNIGKDDIMDEDIFENRLEDEDEIDFSDEKEEKKATSKKSTKAKSSSAAKTKPKKAASIDDKIKEVRAAYELDDEDDFISFIQIWNDDILELDDMEEDDWDEFFEYLESHKDEFEDF